MSAAEKRNAIRMRVFSETHGRCSECGGSGHYVVPGPGKMPHIHGLRLLCSSCNGKRNAELKRRYSSEERTLPLFGSGDDGGES